MAINRNQLKNKIIAVLEKQQKSAFKSTEKRAREEFSTELAAGIAEIIDAEIQAQSDPRPKFVSQVLNISVNDTVTVSHNLGYIPQVTLIVSTGNVTVRVSNLTDSTVSIHNWNNGGNQAQVVVVAR